MVECASTCVASYCDENGGWCLPVVTSELRPEHSGSKGDGTMFLLPIWLDCFNHGGYV